ncbi:MAG: glycosyltransferase family 4 protein, partial [Balneolaceae bacterium]|nr:glycosyltransferase family 4 protein [Balneolaceae bacterium]
INTVLINSSLGKSGYYRDAFFMLLATNKKKRIVFFRGWNPHFEQKIDKSFLLKKIFQYSFLRADQIIVLSSEFKYKLLEWGYQRKIILETTVVDESLISDLPIEYLKKLRNSNQIPNILYLGNLKKEKGVLEIVKAVDHYVTINPGRKIKATIAGSGSMLEKLKSNVDKRRLPIHFPGYVKNDDKIQVLRNANIFLFASYHEGMPNAVIEAMAFGLPILTTRVGGIPDFFEEGKMGFFLSSREPQHIAERIKYLLEQPELMKEMSRYNYHYAKEHFYANKVAKRLEKIIDDVVEDGG